MAVVSCNYPIIHTFDTSGLSTDDTIRYNIYIAGVSNPVYRGALKIKETSSTLEINISDVFRQYLETFYENIDVEGEQAVYGLVPENGNLSSFIIFIVQSDYNLPTGDQYYRVIYNYNTDYISEYNDINLINDPIDNRVAPNQYLFINGFNLGGSGVSSQQYSYQIGGYNDTVSINSGPQQRFQYLALDLSVYPTDSNQEIYMTMVGVKTLTYIVDTDCKNRYVLYYVNKLGGFDSILMSGRSTESWNPERTDVRLYNNRLSRKDWEQKRINQEIDHRFELNTGLLKNEQAAKIDNLIYSPKVFLFDTLERTFTSVLIDENNYSVKEYPYDLVQYTITVKESQKQLRK